LENKLLEEIYSDVEEKIPRITRNQSFETIPDAGVVFPATSDPTDRGIPRHSFFFGLPACSSESEPKVVGPRFVFRKKMDLAPIEYEKPTKNKKWDKIFSAIFIVAKH
jgi:hypothetical protein